MIADRQLMEDYSTLDQSKVDGELIHQMASGYFAALSGKVFEYRDMEQGDDKVCLWQTRARFIRD
jgi:hypothetical protein